MTEQPLLGLDGIKAVIPHRDPFLFLSRVTAMEPGVCAQAEWDIDPQAAWFAGHFPGRPVLPGVLLVESIAQCGALAALSASAYAGKLALFGGASSVKFRRSVLPGDTVTLKVRLEHLTPRGGQGHGDAFVDGQLCCQADVLFVFAKE